MGVEGETPTFYQALGVHPAAPLDLITAAYWHRAGVLQEARASNPDAGMTLYRLTRAYQTLAEPSSRREYDRAINIEPQPPVPRLFLKRRGLARLIPARRGARPLIGAPDHYEVLRVDPSASPGVIDQAYELMRNYYLRVVKLGDQPVDLLDALEEAYAVTSDPALRSRYDQETKKARENGHRVNAAGVLAAPEEQVRETPARVKRPKEKPARAKSRAVRRKQQEKAEAAPQRKERAAREGPPLGLRLRRASLSSARLAWLVVKNAPAACVFAVRAVVAFVTGAWVLLSSLFPEEPQSAPVKLPEDAEQTFLERLTLANVQTSSGQTEEAEEEFAGRLILVDGPASGVAYELSGSSATLGGDGGSDIRLPGVPAQHARLLYRKGKFVLYNLSDAEPIKINGDPVEWAILEDGDSLVVGPYTLRFESNIPAPQA